MGAHSITTFTLSRKKINARRIFIKVKIYDLSFALLDTKIFSSDCGISAVEVIIFNFDAKIGRVCRRFPGPIRQFDNFLIELCVFTLFLTILVKKRF